MENNIITVGENLHVKGKVTTQFSELKIQPIQHGILYNVRDPIESFVGREDYLERLHQLILKNREEGAVMTVLSQTSVVTGLGGVGKTETARMYILRHATHFEHIVWIDSEQREIAEAQFQKLAKQLEISLVDNANKPKPFNIILKQIYQELCQNENLLLIVFDNAESLDDTEHHNDGIGRFLPQSLSTSFLKPAVLVTSRNRDWGFLKVIQLDVWSDDECIVFVLKALLLDETKENVNLAQKLGNTFGRLPLALQVAVAVIRQQSRKHKKENKLDYGIQSLIDDYDEGLRDVLGKKQLESSSPKTTMMVLWNISLEKIKKHEQGDLALKVLNTMSYLSPVSIPKDMVRGVFKIEKEVDLADALILLTDYSLVNNFIKDNYFSVHRMIQDVTVKQLETSEALMGIPSHQVRGIFSNDGTILCELNSNMVSYLLSLPTLETIYDDVIMNAIQMTNFLSKKLSHEYYFLITKYMAMLLIEPNSQVAAKYLKSLIEHASLNTTPTREEKNEVFELRRHYISTLQIQAKYEEALEALELLLQEQENEFGSDCPEAVATKGSIAHILCLQGKYDDALKIYLDLEPQKPLSSSIKHNIGYILSIQGKHFEALKMYEKALELSNSMHDTNDSTTTFNTKANIAKIMVEMGQPSAALELYKEALEMTEKYHGANHPSTLSKKKHIASVLSSEGKYEEAKKILSEVVKKEINIFGDGHPRVLDTKNSIALELSREGDYDQAMKMYEEILEANERVRGVSHEMTLTIRSNIASCLYEQGKYNEAQVMLIKLIEEMETVLGRSHQKLMTPKSYLVAILEKQSRFDESLKLLWEILEIQEAVLGSSHPNTLKALRNIADRKKYQRKYDDAVKVYNKILTTQSETLTPNDPLILATKKEIAAVKVTQRKFDEALLLYKEVLKQETETLGQNHPSSLSTKGKIASILDDQGKHEESLKMTLEVLEKQEQILGPTHSDTLTTKSNCAAILNSQGKYDQAIKIWREILREWETSLGAKHSSTLTVKGNISTALCEKKQYKEAMRLCEEVLEAQIEVLRHNHPSTVKTKHEIGCIYFGMGEYSKAKEIAEEVLELRFEMLGVNHPDYLRTKTLYDGSVEMLQPACVLQ